MTKPTPAISPSTPAPANSTNFFTQFGRGFVYGGATMVTLSPFVNLFNNASVVASSENLKGLQPYKKIYTGVKDAPQNSYWNFFRGLEEHLKKESVRLTFKPAGIYYAKPILDENFSPLFSTVLFSAGLSMLEVAITPIDSMRIRRQNGCGQASLAELYKGAELNGIRQFWTWLVFGIVKDQCDRRLPQTGMLRPDAPGGIVITALAIALGILPVYWIESLRNLKQGHHAGNISTMGTLKNFFTNGQLLTLFRGAGSKVASNAITAGGAIGLLQIGKLHRKG